MTRLFKKILIANRGEIACRVIKTAHRLGIETVAVHSDADRNALHVRMADEAVAIGPAPSAQSYLVIDRIVEAARSTGAEAVHPGYGFLSENPRFAMALQEAGIAFIGPPPKAIEAMGDKITSKRFANEAGVSTVPGYMGIVPDAEKAAAIAADVGFPVMIKASAGGGGKGMRIAWTADEARDGFKASQSEAAASFGDDRIFIEKFVTDPRHIEIQVLADQHGNAIYLGERECSIQRRNQKVVEEAPSPFLDPETRAAMGKQAVALAKAVGYQSAGTVEFIVDAKRNFYFLEMNTRLQVEHPVTELVTGLDLVEEMIRVAAGEPLRHAQEDIRLDGWAMECRLYAEDPYRGFLPSIGRLSRYRPPMEGRQAYETIVRNDTGVEEGAEISMYYDPMIAKLCAWAPDRLSAAAAMAQALDDFEVEGIGHNLPFLSAVVTHQRFLEGRLTTGFIAEEYPDGFTGVPVDEPEARRFAAVATVVHCIAEARSVEISGALDHHRRRVATEWNVSIGAQRFDVSLDRGCVVRFADGAVISVATSWEPGRRHARVTTDGEVLGIKIDPVGAGWRLRRRGMEVVAYVRSPRVAALAALMPVKLPPDTSRLLLCPMPGILKSVDVAEGDAVEIGQALATVEAMKMENTLRATRRATVRHIAARAGASLAVNELIMEFE